MTAKPLTSSEKLENRLLSHRSGVVMLVILIMVAFCLLCGNWGCEREASEQKRRSENKLQQIQARTALFDAFANMLNDLPEEVDLELRPPEVVLDSTNSRDYLTVEAVLMENPQTRRNETILVPRDNSRFQQIGVQPGDVVRLYADQDQYGKFSARQFTVGQVIDDQILLITEPAAQTVEVPARMEIWRYSNKKMDDIDRRLIRYVRRGRPAIAWEPSPDEKAVRKMVEWLNQWCRGQSPDDWRPDPLIATLSEDLQQSFAEQELARPRFDHADGRFLQQAVWHRDVGNRIGNSAADDVDLIRRLFDWSVRNVYLRQDASADSEAGTTPDALSQLANLPWQAILYARGSAAERAWVFVQLCRQQGLPAVILRFGEDQAVDFLQPWLVGVWNDGQLYLFDAQLGLPIPDATGDGVATLNELRANPELLRRLDLSETRRYPLTKADLKYVTAYIPAEPVELSWRMKNVESELAGDQRVLLTVDPSSLAKSLQISNQVQDVRLWEVPPQTLQQQASLDEAARLQAAAAFDIFCRQPRLWQGRVLHFQGKFDGPEAAKAAYLSARVPDEVLKKLPSTTREQVARLMLLRNAKNQASYWLGLITFDSALYEAATDWLQKRTLEAFPDGPWTAAARYNLARALEQLGRTEEAIVLYEADDSAQSYGNHLRACRLKDSMANVQQIDIPATPASPAETIPR